MSVEAVAWALNANPGQATRKLVLIGLANHAHKNGRHAYPSKTTLAEYANVDPKTIGRQLKQLLAAGWIRRGDQGLVEHIRADKRPVVYDLALDEATRILWHSSNERGDNLSPRAVDLEEDLPDDGENAAQTQRGDDLSPRSQGHGGTSRYTAGGHSLVPRTVLEPEPPHPPASGGRSCAKHPNLDGVNCRGCGTTNRQLAAATARAKAAEKRAVDQAAAAASRAALAAPADSPGRQLFRQTRKQLTTAAASPSTSRRGR